MFLSTFESGVDVKKRVSIPAAFRKALGGEDTVILWPAISRPCLTGGGMSLLNGYHRAVRRLKPGDPRRYALEREIFSRAQAARFDDGGRIVIDPAHLLHAGIGDRALFVGLGDSFEVWDPAAYAQSQASLADMAREGMDLLDPFDDDREAGPLS
jgi:MraZ protein